MADTDPPRRNPFEPQANPFATPAPVVVPPKPDMVRPKGGLPSRDFVEEDVQPAPPQARTFSEAVKEGASKAGQQIKDEVLGVPGAIGRAVQDPIQYGKDVAKIPTEIIKSIYHTATLPLTGALYYGQNAGERAGVIPEGSSERYYQNEVKPGVDTLMELWDKYGGWEKFKDTVATKPLEVAADATTVVGPFAGKLIPRVKVPDIASAVTKLDNLGIDTSKLQPHQIDELRKRGNTVGWDKTMMEREVRDVMFKDAGISPTESMLSNSERSRYIEDRMRNGQMGPDAAAKMYDEDMKRRQQVNDYTDRTRANMTGSSARMEPGAIGNKITERYTAADDAAQAAVTENYNKAFDPAELAKRNIPMTVPEADVRGLPGAINAKMSGHPTHPFVATKETAPNAHAAAQYLTDFSKTGRLPNFIDGDPMPPPGTAGITWQSADTVRKHLVGLRESAKNNPTDLLAMNRVIEAFDTQFGKSNPMLNEARKSHSERMKTFHPALHAAGDDIVRATKALSDDQNNGIKQFNKLFGGEFNKGEAIGAINHLKQIFANDPEAMAALREGALERLFINQKDYQHLTPQEMAAQVRQALKGPKAEIYESLFSPEELAHLQRHHEVVKEVGAKMQPINPPRSGHEAVIQQRKDSHQRQATEYISGLLTAIGTGAGYGAGEGAAASTVGGGGLGFGVGRFAGPITGDVWRKIISDPAGARAAGRMSTPDPQKPNPLISKSEHGALTGAGTTLSSQPEERARGGILRRLERH